MPTSLQDRAVILYQQQGFWEQKLRVTNENCAIVLVLGRAGLIRAIASGSFTEELYGQVIEKVRP